MKKRLPARGFSLIELMVVVAIVSVLSGLAVSSYSGIAERNAPQNAAYELSSVFSRARARAAERSANVWVILWPAIGRDGNDGPGAWALYEDYDGSFNLANVDKPSALTETGDNKILDRTFLEDFPKKNVKFGVPGTNTAARRDLKVSSKIAADDGAKDALLDDGPLADGCSFCDGSGATTRGAVVFTPEGEARFYNSNGVMSTPTGGGRVLLVDRDGDKRAFLFTISHPTAYVSFFSN